ncbi:hypothetical protein JCM6882_004603 [Rhodosporidiobolus microsporus]
MSALAHLFAPAFTSPSRLTTTTGAIEGNVNGITGLFTLPNERAVSPVDHQMTLKTTLSHRLITWAPLEAADAPSTPVKTVDLAADEDDTFSPPPSPTFSTSSSIFSAPPSPTFDKYASFPVAAVDVDLEPVRSSVFATKVATLDAFLSSSTTLDAEYISAARAHGVAFIESEEGYEVRLDAARAAEEGVEWNHTPREERAAERVQRKMEECVAALTISAAASRSPSPPSPLRQGGMQSTARTSPLTRCTTSFVPLPAFRTILVLPLPPRTAGWVPPRETSEPTWEDTVAEPDLPFRRDDFLQVLHLTARGDGFEEGWDAERALSDAPVEGSHGWSFLRPSQSDAEMLEIGEVEDSFWDEASSLEIDEEDDLFAVAVPLLEIENDDDVVPSLLAVSVSATFLSALLASASPSEVEDLYLVSPPSVVARLGEEDNLACNRDCDASFDFSSSASSFASLLSDEDASFLGDFSPLPSAADLSFDLSLSASSPTRSPASSPCPLFPPSLLSAATCDDTVELELEDDEDDEDLLSIGGSSPSLSLPAFLLEPLEEYVF